MNVGIEKVVYTIYTIYIFIYIVYNCIFPIGTN